MTFSEVFIKRPVFTSMVSMALVIFGLVGLSRLAVRELPDVDPPIVNVLTVYVGANAEIVETEITEKLEESINAVEGIKTLQSESREAVSNITIEFNVNRDIDIAAQDVRDAVARVRGRLPEDVEEPVIAKQTADARPFLWVALYSDRYDTKALSELAEVTLKDRLETVSGVSSVIIGGEKRYAVRVWLNSDAMKAHGVTALDVEQTLRRENLELPSGVIQKRDREMTVQLLGQINSLEQFNSLVIRQEGAKLVRLGDVARVENGVEDEDSVARYRSRPAVGLGIVRQSKANTIEVARGIKAEMKSMAANIPQEVEYAIAYDESIFIEKAIHEVWLTLGAAFLLVILTVYWFLGDISSTIVPTITIPVAVTATFGLLHFLGFSINVVTMLALVLTIGIVVDDSIVVLENVHRHVEEGMDPMVAATTGMKEIFFAVIATTVSLVVVFLPMALQTSLTGRVFSEFAVTLAGSVTISTFLALSLTPMAAARLLKPLKVNSSNSRSLRYERALKWVLKRPFLALFVCLLIVVLSALAFSELEAEFLPEEDKGRLFSIAIAPEGATSEYTERVIRRLETVISEVPETFGYFTAVALARSGPGKANEGLMFVRFKEERKRALSDILAGPRGLFAQFLGNIEGAIAIPIVPKAISGGFGQPFQLVLQNTDLKKLDSEAKKVAAYLHEAGYLANVRINFKLNKPELKIHIDRDRAATLGVSVRDISRTLQLLYGELDASTFKRNGKEYDVITRLNREHRLVPQELERQYVRNSSGHLISLDNIVRMELAGGPNSIFRYNRLRSVTIEATPTFIPLGTAIDKTKAYLADNLASDFRYEWSGESLEFIRTGNELYWILALALVIVYMSLASQFESLTHPLTVMMTIPLASLGAFGSLWLLARWNDFAQGVYGWANYAPNPPAWLVSLSPWLPRVPAMTINLFSQIGLLLLIALATKNGILLVEFANQKVRKGYSAVEAMVEAGRIRLRPILMTSFSTITGILPIAIGLGAGAESRRPMGVVAVGGLLVSTFLALFIIPVFYVLIARIKERFGLGSSS